ncbi:threonine/serine dehydratase [bacterium]|nr:threonine/serine dehydratase [bacterium]
MDATHTFITDLLPQKISSARAAITPYIRQTPCDHSFLLSRENECSVFLKMENMQVTGSFKARGAAHKLLRLNPEERSRGVVTASSGNHGAACAEMCRRQNIDCTVFVPETVSPAKERLLGMYNIHLVRTGDDCVKAETAARVYAEAQGRSFISPYNDPDIIAGQGTVAAELTEQVRDLDAVFVPVGGGGLISGIAAWCHARNPRIRIIGCQPAHSAVMAASVEAGRILEMESLPTLADGTAGGIEEAAVTFDICRALVHEFILVSEAEIGRAILDIVEQHVMLVEGAAALPLAAFRKTAAAYRGKRVALVLSGARLSPAALKELLA